MVSLIAAFAISAVLSLLLTPLLRDLARRFNCVDAPDRQRKLHRVPTPRIGGVPIFLGCVLAVAVLRFLPTGEAQAVTGALPSIVALLPSVLVVFAVGLYDDLFGLRPWQKLAGQVAAASLACAAGVHIQKLSGHPLELWWVFPLTVMWLVVCSNAFNLIDGVDGLAAGVALVATLTMLLSALLNGNYALALATAPLVGALCGFLRYNFNPASIFLGDCGSLTLGFLLGAYGIVWSQKSVTAVGMTAPLIALAVPLLDTLLTVTRRVIRGRSIFGADRLHVHHRLLDRGLTPRRAVLLLYGACGIAATFSLLLSVARGEYAGLIIVLFCAAAWLGVQRLGYLEFQIAGRFFHPRTFRRVMDAEFLLHSFERSLSQAETLDECRVAVLRTSEDLGFCYLALRLGRIHCEEWIGHGPSTQCWTLQVPLSDTDFIRLGHGLHDGETPVFMAQFVDLLRGRLVPKLAVLQVEQKAMSVGAAEPIA
jgi:UDP-GlcNAc:undecaprenyl-phosphate GlcNAc-1-phosphate transferase